MATLDGGNKVKKFRQNCFLVEIYCHFSVTVVAYCRETRFGFVAGDKGDLLMVATCPEVAVISREEAEKIVMLCYRTTPAMVFQALVFHFLSKCRSNDIDYR